MGWFDKLTMSGFVTDIDFAIVLPVPIKAIDKSGRFVYVFAVLWSYGNH